MCIKTLFIDLIDNFNNTFSESLRQTNSVIVSYMFVFFSIILFFFEKLKIGKWGNVFFKQNNNFAKSAKMKNTLFEKVNELEEEKLRLTKEKFDLEMKVLLLEKENELLKNNTKNKKEC